MDGRGGLAVRRKKDRRKEAIAIIYHDVLTGIQSSWGGFERLQPRDGERTTTV